jgi:hypothetical protein
MRIVSICNRYEFVSELMAGEPKKAAGKGEEKRKSTGFRPFQAEIHQPDTNEELAW